jgi:two-component system response regulator ChvI
MAECSVMNKKPSVAVVDDERNNVVSLGIVLEEAGFHVRSYTDTASAFEALAAEPADVAILDWHNRPFDGLELFRRLRALSDMPIIFLSANAHVLEEMDVGADEYIVKPFSQRFLVDRVKAVLRRHQRS